MISLYDGGVCLVNGASDSESRIGKSRSVTGKAADKEKKQKRERRLFHFKRSQYGRQYGTLKTAI